MLVMHCKTVFVGSRSALNLLLIATTLSVGCGGSDGGSDGPGSDESTGGAAGAGVAGASAGGLATGGASTAGTSSTNAGGASGGGGKSTGGANAGGTSAGGANAGSSGGGTHAGGASAGGSTSSGGTAGASSGAAGSTGAGCSVTPVDPNATAPAKKLLCYLYSQYKNHVLSGQQETSWSNPVSDIDFYQTNTGKYPAILGGDFLYTGTTPSSQGTTTSRAQAYWEAGGIPMFRYHMGAPPNADSYANSMLDYSSTQCNNVVTAGTTENTSYKSKLDYVAGNLMTLQNAGVAVIFALFHETQPSGWFWWSKCSSSQFLALYKYSYDYLVNTKGIHNMVRLMPFSGTVNTGFYPGKAQVDLAGPDTYATNPPFGSTYSSAASVVGSTIPIPLHETGSIPQPSTMFPMAAPWLLWNVWAGYETSQNSVADIKSAYASEYTVTRDELPSFK